jgi:hypothetical protein
MAAPGCTITGLDHLDEDGRLPHLYTLKQQFARKLECRFWSAEDVVAWHEHDAIGCVRRRRPLRVDSVIAART